MNIVHAFISRMFEKGKHCVAITHTLCGTYVRSIRSHDINIWCIFSSEFNHILAKSFLL